MLKKIALAFFIISIFVAAIIVVSKYVAQKNAEMIQQEALEKLDNEQAELLAEKEQEELIKEITEENGTDEFLRENAKPREWREYTPEMKLAAWLEIEKVNPGDAIETGEVNGLLEEDLQVEKGRAARRGAHQR